MTNPTFRQRFETLPKPPTIFEPEGGEELGSWASDEVQQALDAIEARDRLILDMIQSVEGLPTPADRNPRTHPKASDVLRKRVNGDMCIFAVTNTDDRFVYFDRIAVASGVMHYFDSKTHKVWASWMANADCLREVTP